MIKYFYPVRMKTKFTLGVEEDIVKQAKIYAKENGTTVSEIFEKLVNQSTKKKIRKEDIVISPFIGSMVGSNKFEGSESSTDEEMDNLRYEYLKEKYG